jgi:hypothetical protein
MMKRQIVLTALLIFLVSSFSSESRSQIITEDLELRLITLSAENTGSSIDKPKVIVNIKNISKGTVKFSNLKLYLSPRGADEECRSADCLFAFAGRKADKLKNQEFIAVEVELDSVHWYNAMASHFFPSTTKNLFDKVSSGEFQVSATVDIEAIGKKKTRDLTRVISNTAKIIFQ